MFNVNHQWPVVHETMRGSERPSERKMWSTTFSGKNLTNVGPRKTFERFIAAKITAKNGAKYEDTIDIARHQRHDMSSSNMAGAVSRCR